MDSPPVTSTTQALALGNSDRRYQGVYKAWGQSEKDHSGPSVSCLETDGLSGVQGQSPAGAYKDSVAKTATPEKVSSSSCGTWAVVAECSTGKHHFAKKLVCGQEWCAVCGEDDSSAHKRRQARLLPKIQQIKQLGYFVVEFPDICRHVGRRGLEPDVDGGKYVKGWCYSKVDLQKTTSEIVEVLAGKRCGRRGRVGGYFQRGVARWHWFGEKRPGKWNPHLNILVDGAYIDPELLDTIKAKFRAALSVPDLIVHYAFFDKPGQMVQKVRYVTRATFRNRVWDGYMANELYNFRNTRWWGNWQGEPVWELAQVEAEGEDIAGLEAVASLQSGLCSDCGQPLKVLYHNRKDKVVCWTRPVDSIYLELWQAQEISGTGYYRIPHKEWSGYNFSPDELMNLEKLEHKARDKPTVLFVAALARQHLENKLAAGRWWLRD